jgi:hypothetical protein
VHSLQQNSIHSSVFINSLVLKILNYIFGGFNRLIFCSFTPICKPHLTDTHPNMERIYIYRNVHVLFYKTSKQSDWCCKLTSCKEDGATFHLRMSCWLPCFYNMNTKLHKYGIYFIFLVSLRFYFRIIVSIF